MKRYIIKMDATYSSPLIFRIIFQLCSGEFFNNQKLNIEVKKNEKRNNIGNKRKP